MTGVQSCALPIYLYNSTNSHTHTHTHAHTHAILNMHKQYLYTDTQKGHLTHNPNLSALQALSRAKAHRLERGDNDRDPDLSDAPDDVTMDSEEDLAPPPPAAARGRGRATKGKAVGRGRGKGELPWQAGVFVRWRACVCCVSKIGRASCRERVSSPV